MVSASTKSIIQRAKVIYESHRESLEANYRDQFVAIEPDSEEYFVADSFDAAVKAAKSRHPQRLTHTIHIGHAAAFQIGLMTK